MQAYSALNGSRHPTAAAIVMKRAGAMPHRNDAMTAKRVGVARALGKGEELFAEGEAADFFYKVVSGTVRTYKLLSDGRRQIDEFHLAGDIFGLETGEDHRFSADAVDAATVVAFRHRRFETLAHDDPALGDQVMSSMMRSLERAHDHMMLLGRKTAQEKVATFLLDMARRVSKEDRFDLPMQRTDIADHLGLTIETVSRTLTQFAREGLIKLAAASRSIVLCDKAALRRLNA
ncbi:MAG: helix-turn-helix domain-containing protein [Reyranella sp.]|uniref:helix-turn-helix domain-containing protein n=1 Tax=Reyranella sp. TaxID=1929291 RepID=UPI00272F5FD8|nr:helix-turn-helix domain-containing protein [Reyranella sp.]MDP1963676.1 helix-turn-helix domain-containing protein [Reyranella sp.]MDP2374309.1 helix-turn-helix domain-containing protein [Reyranella sp.]